MEQKEIDILLKENNFKKLFSYIEANLSQIAQNEIINIVKYKELLLNKESNNEKKTKLIEPLKRLLKSRNVPIEDYIKCCDSINFEFKELNKYINNQYNEIFNYNFNTALINILSKIENYNHKIMKRGIELEINSPESLINSENLMREYQCNIEGLSLLLKGIFLNKNRFKKSLFANREMFFSNVKRCMKKTFKLDELLNYITSVNNLNDIVEKIQEYDIKFLNVESDTVCCFQFKNIDEYKKKAIASERCKSYDLSSKVEYINTLKLDKDFETKLDKQVNWDNLIEPYDGNFKIKFELFSDEQLKLLIESYKEFSYQINLMINNSFLNDELNNKIIGESFKYNITYKQAIDFYYMLQFLSFTYFKATEVYKEKFGEDPIIPFLALNKNLIMTIITPIYKNIFCKSISEEELEELISLYTFSKNNIFDLYYKPIIKVEDTFVIIPSIIKNNNFGRTFIEHMNLIKVNFKSGILYEEYLKDLFKKNGFLVYDKKSPQLNFDMGNNKKGDIDLLMMKGKYIFYSQIKNRANPIESRDYIAFDRKINRLAIKQLNYAKEFLRSNPKYITDFFGVDDLKKYELIPFIITNSFYASGDRRNGVYITDTSSLNVFLEQGEINIMDFKGKIIYNKKLRNANIEEDLVNHLKNPYFKDEKLYYDLYTPSVYPINNKLYVVKVDDYIIKEQNNSCYIKNSLKQN